MKNSYAVFVTLLLLAARPALCQPLPGAVDLFFNAGSIINAPVYATAALSDGKVAMTGDFRMISGEMINGLARLQTNGATDLTFTNNLGVDFYGRALLVEPDGKLVVGGQLSYYGGFYVFPAVLRFDTDGSVLGGRYFSAPYDSYVHALALQRDGKILFAGDFVAPGGSGTRNVFRLNSDFSPDTTFLYGLAGANGTVNALALQGDGRILIGGSFTSVNGSTRIGIARLQPDGSLDNSFSASVSGGIKSMAVQSDGKIVIGGDFTSVNGTALNRIARLNADGSSDGAFSAGRTGADGTVAAVTLQSNGKIVLVGSFTRINGTSQRGAARLNTDGSRDSTFSVGSGGLSGAAYSATSLPTGEILVSGALTAAGGMPVNNLVKLGPTGTPDPTFGNGSTFINGMVSCVVTQTDARILINGVSGAGIGRLETNGAPDPKFLAGMTGANGAVNAIGVSNNKILIGGAFSQVNGYDCRALARLNPDGSLDTSFAKGIGGSSGTINRLVVQPDGKVLVGGNFTDVQGVPRNNLARVKLDGSLDAGFLNNLDGINGQVHALAIQPDSKILVGGSFDTVNGVARPGIARLNPDGSLDAAFQTNSAGVAGTVYAIAIQPDAKILIGGYFSSINNTSVTDVARLNIDGSLDLSFNSGTISGGSAGVQAIALQDDGKVLIGGQFTQVGTLALNNIARLSATGAVEAFMTAGADAPVYAMSLLDDTRMLVGGSFASINGEARSFVSRVFYRSSSSASIPLDEALNNSQLSWTNDAVAPWQGQTAISHDGVASAQSGLITDNQSTSLRSSVVGPGLISFWWKVSSETNYDFLTFTSVNPDGTTNSVRISGETGWVQETIALPPGTNSLDWTYSKDYSVSMGLDAGWVDEVTFTVGFSAPIVLSNPSSATNVAGGTVTFRASATGSAPLSYQWLLNGVAIPDATNSIYSASSIVPEQAGSYALRITSPYGTNVTADAQLVVIPIRAYGANDYGQTTISNFTIDAVAIAAGQQHSLLLRRDGSVYAWGDNANGQCSVPANLGPALGIAGGAYHSLAITAGRTVVGWGDNTYGQISPPAGLSDVTAVAAGFLHSLALRADGTVVAWGDNTFEQTTVPASLNNVVAIAAGGNHSLALRSDGVVFAWGQNTDAKGFYSGQSSVPWNLNGVVAIAAGEYHSLATKRDGSVVAWGDNSYGQCNVPTNVVAAIAVAGGGTHSLAVLADGTAAGWGDNFYGQSALPPTLTNIVAVAAGNVHSLELFGLRPAPRLANPVWRQDQFSVDVPTFSDRLYSLEYSSSLPSTNWLPLPLVRGLGKVQTLTNTSAVAPRRFYRVSQW